MTIENEERIALWLLLKKRKPRISKKYFDVLYQRNHIYLFMKVCYKQPYKYEPITVSFKDDDNSVFKAIAQWHLSVFEEK